MKMIDLISKKRNGETHTKEEIQYLINGIKNSEIPDYQISAWLMAVCFQGMDFDECAALTEEMAKSGDILDLSVLGNYVIDKHSTGGVGDKITLILIPLLAAAGIPVAKLSGRGLGFTGGTIDKLESIPGFNTSISEDMFIEQIKDIGVAIAGQTAQLAPADGKLYALRDVTSTVDCLPLIASSVVSKKIASGANVIVLDVKFGNGSFVKTKEEAEELSNIMVGIGKKLGRSITAVITSMEQPLGFAIGNSVEVKESIDVLQGGGPSDVRELTLYLSAIALMHAKKVSTIKEGKEKLAKHLDDGSAFVKFKELVKAQGGNTKSLENVELLPTAKYSIEVQSNKSGYVSKLCAIEVAKACKLLGAGRDKKEDSIDFSVGVLLDKKIGDKVEEGEILGTIKANCLELAEQACVLLFDAFEITDIIVEPELIYKIIE